MGYFWDAIQEEHLDDKAIQTELDRIGEWISVVERNKPVNIGRPSLAR